MNLKGIKKIKKPYKIILKQILSNNTITNIQTETHRYIYIYAHMHSRSDLTYTTIFFFFTSKVYQSGSHVNE